jgi:hypothetical protein
VFLLKFFFFKACLGLVSRLFSEQARGSRRDRLVLRASPALLYLRSTRTQYLLGRVGCLAGRAPGCSGACFWPFIYTFLSFLSFFSFRRFYLSARTKLT